MKRLPCISVPFSCFQYFLFIFYFQPLASNGLWCVFLCIYLVWVSLSFLYLYTYVLMKFEKTFWPFISSIFFFVPFSLLSFWDIKYMLEFNFIPLVLVCIHFFQPFFSFFIRDNFYWFILDLPNLSPIISIH